MNSTGPEVSVILVSWNRKEDLRLALESLGRQRGISAEIIVVDNGSTDGTLEMLAGWPIKIRVVANQENRGACIGKNQGIREARSTAIAFMDSDAVLVNPDTLHDLTARLRADPSLGGVAGPIYYNRELTAPWVFGIHFSQGLYIDWEKTRTLFGEAEALSTCFLVMPRKAALEAGGFDPVFFYQHEDLDFFLRVREQGCRLQVMSDYPVWHRISQVGRNLGSLFWLHFREEWRHQYLLIKHWGFIRAFRFFARNLIDSSAMRAYYIRPIGRKKFLALFVALPVAMLALSPWIALQRKKSHLGDLGV